MGENAPDREPGYSNYVFANGDSLQVAFMSGPDEASGDYTVEYDIRSGTGAYAGARGTGHLVLQPSEWGEDAALFEGSFTVQTPD